MENSSKSIFNNFVWRFFERIGAQGVAFIISIVLARLLDPSAYGTIALITVITAILQVFIDSGMGTALIQKKDADDIDFSSVFYFNLVFSLILYTLVFFAAPYIALFYENTALTPMIRVLGLTLIVSGVKNVQQAYVSKKLLFKKFFFSTIGGTIGSAIIGIWLAYSGYGVWALIFQNLINEATGTLILWITVNWKPKRMFSLNKLKGLFKYGWKLLVSSLLETTYKEIRSLVIGKMYTSADLAYYNKGQQFPQLIITNINTSIDSILLPVMSAEQDKTERVKAMTRRAIQISSYIIMPLMLGLAACAEPFIRLLLTEKWLPCVIFLRVFCLTMAFYPIHTANLNAIKAMGRSDMFLKLEIIKKIYGIAALLITMWISVEAMAYSLLITTLFSGIVNAFPNKKLLGYGYIEQMKDLFPSFVLSVVMGVAVFAVSYLALPDILTLVIQVVLGAVIYIVASAVFKLESFTYITTMIKGYLKKRSIKG